MNHPVLGFVGVKDLTFKAESGFVVCWVISALGFQLAQSGLILLLCPALGSSLHIF